ncbi:MAG: SIS domain-containing protein [Clostridia bacterium]|nr:SIS domain-containing protein [Clostridia bacterium]
MSKMLEEILEQPKVLKNHLGEQKELYRELARVLKAKKIHNVVFAARGSSDHAAIYGQYLMTKYCGAVCGLATPSAITKYGAAPNYAKTLVIGISQSGQAADVIAVLESAKATGAITAAITNDAESPLAKMADFSFLCHADKEESVAATKTFTAQMFCLARLTAAWSSDSELKKEIAALPALLTKNINTLYKSMLSVAPRYTFMTDGFVLGRGLVYPIALESALKIKETNYIRMQGAASSDFYHGPLAQVAPGTPVIVLAMNGPCFDDSLAMIERLNEIGADVLCFTDNAALAARANAVLCSNSGTDVSAAFLAAVMAQLFACCLADCRGKNPDAPHFLKKVTITK